MLLQVRWAGSGLLGRPDMVLRWYPDLMARCHAVQLDRGPRIGSVAGCGRSRQPSHGRIGSGASRRPAGDNRHERADHGQHRQHTVAASMDLPAQERHDHILDKALVKLLWHA